MGDEIQNATTTTQDDLLERLLAGAATKAAEVEAAKVLSKGVVTKSEISAALGQFETNLLSKVEALLTAKAVVPVEENEETVAKAGAMVANGRKGTIAGSSNPRDDNPIKYLVQKARSEKPVYDETDKQLMWALTLKGMTAGMSYDATDGVDFGDEYGDN